MLEDRIRIIEARIRSSQNIPESTRAELLEQLASLETELKTMPPGTRPAAGKTSAPGVPQPDLFEEALADLNATVSDLEASHPGLAAAVNRLAIALSNMGI